MASPEAQSEFSRPTETHAFRGILFDFDGTIVDSTPAIVKYWHTLGREIGVDPEVILATAHGRRSIDTLKIYDESKANWEYICEMEGRIPREFGQDAKEIPGARKVLEDLEKFSGRWAVVTSGTRPLIHGWLDVMKLAHPKCLVTAEEVQRGKPDPEGYLMGAQRLGLEHVGPVLVVEDAPSGLRAAKAAGCRVVGLTTTHSAAQVREAGADWIIRDLRDLTVIDERDGLILVQISNALTVGWP